MRKKLAIAAFLLMLCSLFAFSAELDNLTLKVAVMGPGDELYFWWGHIALIVEDAYTGRSLFYDYGLFSFDNENFFYNFAFGRLLYSCGVSYTDANLAGYVAANRDIFIYTLDLPSDAKRRVIEFANINVLPENRDYYYHHFRDNCSTRIRDIIDLAVEGQFYEQYGEAPGRFTLREHIRRHMWFSPAVDWLLNFLMGQVIDTPITVWEEMFLPSEVGKRIEDFYYTDSGGERRKLVSSVETYFKSQNRPIVLDEPEKNWPGFFIFSLTLSAIFAFFFFLQAKNHRLGRKLAGFSMSLSGFVFGFAGLLLYFMSLFTNHDYTYENFNMLFGTPLLLVSFPLGISYALTKLPQRQFFYGALLRLIWMLTVLGIIISAILKLHPNIYQQNLADQLLMLPIALVFAFQPVGFNDLIQKYFPKKQADA